MTFNHRGLARRLVQQGFGIGLCLATLCASTASASPLPPRSLYHLAATLEQPGQPPAALASLRGRPVVVTMFYADCTSVCPLLAHAMSQLDKSLPEGRREQLDYLLVSLDAAHDTAPVLATFAEEHHLTGPRWHVAHVRADEVRSLAAALGIRYRQLPDGSFSHASRLTLLDADGTPVARTEVLTTVDESFREAVMAALPAQDSAQDSAQESRTAAVTAPPGVPVPATAPRGAPVPATGPPASSPANRAGFAVSFRLRQEAVDDDSYPRSADAGTLRSRLALNSASFHGLRGLVEVDDVRAYATNYQSTTRGPADRPVVADPTGTDLNVAALEWTRGKTRLVAGRQRINLDQQRFVGGSGWRQNEQTFDGAFASWQPRASLELSAAYLTQVNRVFGPSNGTQQARWHGDVAVLQGQWKSALAGTWTPFFLAMRFDNAAAVSNRTLGLVWRQQVPLAGGWSLPLAAAWATQSDAGRNPTDYTTHYSLVEAGLGKGAFSAKLGREVLGGHATLPGRRFQTPLATLHAFQGWVDKFLTTPPQGVEDTYASVQWKTPRATAQLVWHDFRAAAVNRPYGEEWDASVSLPFATRYEVLLKGGRYRSTGYGTSATKLWAQFSAKF